MLMHPKIQFRKAAFFLVASLIEYQIILLIIFQILKLGSGMFFGIHLYKNSF